MMKAGWAVIVAAIVLVATYTATAAPACQSYKNAGACKAAGCAWVAAKKGNAKCQVPKVAPRR